MTDPAVAGFSGNVSQYQVRTITHLPHLSTLTTPSVFLFQKNLVPKKEFIPKNNVLVLQKKDLIWLLKNRTICFQKKTRFPRTISFPS